MRFRTLNAATQVHEEVQVPAGDLYVKLSIHEGYGDARIDSGRYLLIGLDDLTKLVSDRIVVMEAAGDETPKPRRKAVAA